MYYICNVKVLNKSKLSRVVFPAIVWMLAHQLKLAMLKLVAQKFENFVRIKNKQRLFDLKQAWFEIKKQVKKYLENNCVQKIQQLNDKWKPKFSETERRCHFWIINIPMPSNTKLADHFDLLLGWHCSNTLWLHQSTYKKYSWFWIQMVVRPHKSTKSCWIQRGPDIRWSTFEFFREVIPCTFSFFVFKFLFLAKVKRCHFWFWSSCEITCLLLEWFEFDVDGHRDEITRE